MELKELLSSSYRSVVIQCHDNPDADALASGFTLLRFFEENGWNGKDGRTARFIYGGVNEIRKSDLVRMVEMLEIPVAHVRELPEPDLLVLVDCQYGERNVEKFPAKTIAVIDHHQPGLIGVRTDYRDIRSTYGSCATILWDLFEQAGFDVRKDERLATALYYGLFMDTAGLRELRHPKDRDLRDALEFHSSQSILFQLENCNLSLDELRLAGQALADYTYMEDMRCAIVEARRCDPNILGIISDMLISVDAVDIAVVYSNLGDRIKYSVRSSTPLTKANDLSAFIGDGGGHTRKAGGQLSLADAAAAPIAVRVRRYFSEQDVYDVKKGILPEGIEEAPLFEKKRLCLGYVKATDLGFTEGNKILVREMEGDKEVTVQDDTYLIIGAEDEVYTNTEAYFLAHNDPTDEPYVFHGKYAPKIHGAVTAAGMENGEGFRNLADCAKICYSRGGARIHARQLTKRTKVFPAWSEDYFLGMPGDWLAAREEDPSDIYIINQEIMPKTYDPVEG